MSRPFSSLVGLSLSSAFLILGCLSQPTALPVDGGLDAPSGASTRVGDAPTGAGDAKVDGGACNPATDPECNPNDEDSVPPYITYMDDLATHPGCTTAGLATRAGIDGTPAGYTPAVINGGKFTCAAKDYGTPSPDDPDKPIIVLVHGNSSTPDDWETYPSDPQKTPMIAETLVADGYHVYASDVRFDQVPTNMNNQAKNYDHGWAEPIVESLLTNLFEQYPPPRMFNIAGFSIGPTVIRDSLRRMLRKGLNPFARVHALHYASGGNHGVSTYQMYCGNESSPMNGTMAGLAACQLGNREMYEVTPFEKPLNGGNPPDIQSFDTPCSDGMTAYGQTGVCGGNKVVYTTIVFADQPNGTLLDEFVSQTSSALVGATNMTVTEPEPGVCTGSGASMTCTGYFFYPDYEYHYGSIRSAQGIAAAKAALETN